MLQSGHGRRDRRTDGQTDRRTDRRTEWIQYTPNNFVVRGVYLSVQNVYHSIAFVSGYCTRFNVARDNLHKLFTVIIRSIAQAGSFTYGHEDHTVYPKKYAHGFCFAVLCCGYTLTDFPISIRLTSLALWQSNDCPSASKATLMNVDKYFMWIHYERLYNHNKAKHNKTVCIFLGIYCSRQYFNLISIHIYLKSHRHVESMD